MMSFIFYPVNLLTILFLNLNELLHYKVFCYFLIQLEVLALIIYLLQAMLQLFLLINFFKLPTKKFYF